MKKIYLGFLISLLSTATHAQDLNFEWAKSIGGIFDDVGYSITADTYGNVYLTGSYMDTVDFDPSAGIFNLTSNGGSDVFIQKLDASGNFIWAKSMGGTSYDYSHSITTDASGNVYVTGRFLDTVDFDPSAGIFNLTSNGNWDVFIQKLDISGNLIWAKSMGGIYNDQGQSITTSASGNVYVTGYFNDTADFDPDTATFNLTSNGINDFFIQKLDTGGNLIWAKSMGGAYNDQGRSITTSASGNVYVTGYFNDTADFDPDTATFNLTSNGINDFFIQKLDTSGNLIWAKSVGGTGYDYGLSITTDASDNVYVTGGFQGIADFNPDTATFNLTSKGTYDIFIQKLDAGGNFIWAKSMGGTGIDYGASITTHASGNLHVTGYYTDTCDFDPNAATFNLTSNGYTDVFIQELDTSGNFIWAKSMGGIFDDYGHSITTDASGNVYVTGSFKDTVDFGLDTATFNFASNGYMDVFILKLSQCASSTGTDVITTCDSYTWIDGNTYTASNNMATFNFAGGAANGCDSLVTLNLTINNAAGTDVQTTCNTYDWIDGNTYTSSNDTATFNIVDGAANGCDSLVTLFLTLNTVDVTITTTDASITSNATGASYQWLDCNNSYAVITGDTTQSFTASVNGDYAVAVTENGCTDTSACITISAVGIVETPLFNSVSIFPNPNQGLLNVDLGDLKNVSIKVTSASGQLIYEEENINASIHQFELKETPGVYILEVSSQGEIQQYKLVKK